MKDKYILLELEKNIQTFKALLNDVPGELILWKQSNEKWCLLEIVCHLYDEEREDFRARVKHLLSNPFDPLPPIDPQGWVKERDYISRNYNEMVVKFLDERRQSVQWLGSLQNPEWRNNYDHPHLGKVNAEMFFINWLAHDYLHFRQITKLKYDYLKHSTSQELNYAGNW